MLMPSIFGEDMFDEFMRDFPFFDENAGNKIEERNITPQISQIKIPHAS